MTIYPTGRYWIFIIYKARNGEHALHGAIFAEFAVDHRKNAVNMDVFGLAVTEDDESAAGQVEGNGIFFAVDPRTVRDLFDGIAVVPELTFAGDAELDDVIFFGIDVGECAVGGREGNFVFGGLAAEKNCNCFHIGMTFHKEING